MGVRADNQFARADQAFFRQQGMFNAHLSDIEEIDDLVLACEIAAGQALLCGLDVFVRCEMIHNERNLVAIKHLVKSSLFHLTDGNRAGNIIRQCQVEICLDQLTCGYAFQPRMTGENFLCHSHCHEKLPPLFIKICLPCAGRQICSAISC